MTLRKRSIAIAGHRTSISLEEPFWLALKQLAAARGSTVAAIIAEVDARRGAVNLSSALRVHLLETLQAALGPSGLGSPELSSPPRTGATTAAPEPG